MSISHTIRIISRVDAIVSDLVTRYTAKTEAHHELVKLQQSLHQLDDYLKKLDQLKTNYNPDDVNSLVNSIDLNLVILKKELEQPDYAKLLKGVKALKAVLRFHPVKYSFFTFIVAWVIEFIYFI